MNVLHIVATADRTGVETVVRSLAYQMNQQGVSVTVLSFSEGPLIDVLKAAGIPHHVIPVAGKLDWRAVGRIRDYLKGNDFAVVHTHGSRAMLFGNVAARLAGVSVVVTTFHQFVEARQTIFSKFYALVERVLIWRFTDACVVPSDALQQAMRPITTTRIYNGLDLSRFTKTESTKTQFGLQDDDMVIGAIGRLSPVKGHRYLVDALPKIQAVFPKATILLLGTGPMADALHQQAKALGISQQVKFAGELDDTSLFYNALDVLVHPSLSESFGLVLLEAMMCGVRIVASDVGGIPEVLKFTPHGALIPPGDVDAIANETNKMLQQKDYQYDGQVFQKIKTTFSADKIAMEHVQLYQILLENR